MTLEEFDQKMNEKHEKLLSMRRETAWERHLYNEAQNNMLWADVVLREQIKEGEKLNTKN